MYNFTYHVPTRINFGKGAISHLSELAESGSKALLVYGGGSIKRNGIYDEALRILSEAGVQVTELAGVEPNPRIQTVRRGVDLCRQCGLQMVLAIGGGSTIDAAKVIAAGALYDGDPWDLVLDGSKANKALPIYSVLTLSATGSEMDKFAVITDMSKNEKWGTGAPCMVPTMSVLDPTYTFTVSRRQTAAGTADMMSHTFENYFTREQDVDVQKEFCEGLLRTMVKYGPIALQHPDDYAARANLMWCAAMAQSNIVGIGHGHEWTTHALGNPFSAIWDTTHGATLSALFPHWARYVMDTCPERFAQFAVNVFGVDPDFSDPKLTGLRGIAAYERWCHSIGMPTTISEMGVDPTDEELRRIAQDICVGRGGTCGFFQVLTVDDVERILLNAR